MYKYLTYYEPIMDGFICPATVSYEHLKKVLPHRRRDIRLIPHGIPDAGDSPPKFDGGEYGSSTTAPRGGAEERL